MQDVHVIIELSIEASKHDERTADEDRRVSSSWLGKLVLEINLTPLLLVQVETVQISNVLFVSSAKNVDFVVIDSGRVTPPSIRK